MVSLKSKIGAACCCCRWQVMCEVKGDHFIVIVVIVVVDNG